MTPRGVLREVRAAQRRAARNDERQRRAHARAEKLQAKINEMEHAAAEAEEFADRLAQLTSIHHNVGDGMDWEGASTRSGRNLQRQAGLHRWDRLRAEFIETRETATGSSGVACF